MEELFIDKIRAWNFAGSNINCILLDNEPLFNPYDVGLCLDIKKESVERYIRDFDNEDKVDLKSIPGIMELNHGTSESQYWLKEPGLYQLIFRSRKPEAKTFVKWITTEVLPTLRKTGFYQLESGRDKYLSTLVTATEQLLGIRQEELAILQSETWNKKLANLIIDCARAGMGHTKDLYDELSYVFECETGVNVQDIAEIKGLSRRDYLKKNQALCKTVYEFAYDLFKREDRQVYLVTLDQNQALLTEF